MQEDLLTCKSLEQRGRIGPLHIHEVVLLLVGSLLVFFGVLLLRRALELSLMWLLAAPAFFLSVCLALQALRKDENPSFLASWIAFYCQQPRKMR